MYWSLSDEVFFYILYIVICVPTIHYFAPKTRIIKVGLLLALMPFFLLIYYLTKNILMLNYSYLYYFYYFVTGMALGYIYKNHKTSFTTRLDIFFENRWLYIFPVILFFIAIIINHVLVDHFQSQLEVIQVLFAIPFTFFFAFALNRKNSLSKFLSSKFLVFIGTISDSLYLSLGLIVPVIYSVFPRTKQIIYVGPFVLLAFAVTVFVSYILYYLLERPYFVK